MRSTKTRHLHFSTSSKELVNNVVNPKLPLLGESKQYFMGRNNFFSAKGEIHVCCNIRVFKL